jgi:hypothetical protein
MSGSTVVRRLTAVVALLAVFCLAAPAVAATPGSHTVKAPVAVHVGLFDQLVSWLATLGFGSAPRVHASTITSTINSAASITSLPTGTSGQATNSSDASQGMDPNGHQ